MIALEPTPVDYASLWKQFPLAEERLKVIILTRLLIEARNPSQIKIESESAEPGAHEGQPPENI